MLNEHDLADYEQLPFCRLYDVEPRSYIDVGGEIFFFDHIDGLYSYCLNMSNEVVHIPAFAQVMPMQKKNP